MLPRAEVAHWLFAAGCHAAETEAWHGSQHDQAMQVATPATVLGDFADVTFAKLELVAHCERDGVPYVPWNGFDDIREWLESDATLPGPMAPVRCPGWMLPPN